MVASKISSRDVQRLFLQAVMSRRILSEKLAKNLWQRCIEAVRVAGNLEIEQDYSDEAWNTFVKKISENIDPFSLDFKHIVDESSSTKIYGIVNTNGDEVAQLASDYSALEISLFKAVVEQIMLASNKVFSISSTAALREVTSLKSNMTRVQAENVLASFVAKGWLLYSKKGRYSLASRALLELDVYLRQNYEDEHIECTICADIITKGFICKRDNCHTYMHKHCYTFYRRSKSECPTCKKSWVGSDGTSPLGEDAAKDNQDDRRKARRKSKADDSEGEEDDASQDVDASQVPSQTQSSQALSRTQKKGKSKKEKVPPKNGRGKTRAETPETDEDEPAQESDAVMNIDDEEQIAQPTQNQRRGRSKRE